MLTNIKLEVVKYTSQKIHFTVQVSSSSQPLFLSAIYASTSFNNIFLLWENLKYAAQEVEQRNLHWTVFGTLINFLTPVKILSEIG